MVNVDDLSVKQLKDKDLAVNHKDRSIQSRANAPYK